MNTDLPTVVMEKSQHFHHRLERLTTLRTKSLVFLPPVLLVVLCLVFFQHVLIGYRYTFPWDFVEFMYPAQRFISDAIHAGELPLWNPYVLSGHPIVGDPQASLFYPFYLLFHVLPGKPQLTLKMFELLEILHIAVAGCAAYFLSRTIGLQRLGAFSAGLVFMLGGFFPVHVEHETWVKSSIWIPVLLMLTIRMLNAPKLWHIPALALTFSLTLLGGYTQIALLSIYLLGFYLIWNSYSLVRHRQYITVIIHVGMLSAALLLGLGVSAVQILPSVELLSHSMRGTASYTGSQLGGLAEAAPLTFLLPTVFGSDGAIPWTAGEVTHTQKYFGLAPLIFLLLAFLIPLQKPYANFFRVFTLVTLLGSFGPALYVYRLVEMLPFITLFRRPATLFPFAMLGIAVLSGMVCDALVKPAGHWRERRASGLALLVAELLGLVYLFTGILPAVWPSVTVWLWPLAPANITALVKAPMVQRTALAMTPYITVLVGLLVALLFVSRARRLVVVLLVALTFIDLYSFNAGQIFNAHAIDPQTVFGPTILDGNEVPGVASVRAEGRGRYRLGTANYAGSYRNGASVLQVESVNGYNPLLLRTMTEFFGAIPSVNSRLFDLLNVKYLITSDIYLKKSDPMESFSKVSEWWQTGHVYLPAQALDTRKFVFRTSTTYGWFQLWENQRVLPRFFGVNRYEVIQDGPLRLKRLSQAEFDPGREIILQEPIEGTLNGRLAEAVAIRHYGNNSVEVAANVLEGDVLLFMSIPYYPGWSARVNGTPSPIYVANHAFMAVRLGSGTHTVRLDFRPISFVSGAIMTVLSLVCCLVLSLLFLQRWSKARSKRASWPVQAGL